jgi:hypothetical protein
MEDVVAEVRERIVELLRGANAEFVMQSTSWRCACVFKDIRYISQSSGTGTSGNSPG